MRQPEPESLTLVDRATSGRFASDQCLFSFRLPERGRNRTPKYYRVGLSWSDRTSGLSTGQVTSHNFRLLESTRLPRSLCQCQSHSWEASVSRHELAEDKSGIGQRLYCYSLNTGLPSALLGC